MSSRKAWLILLIFINLVLALIAILLAYNLLHQRVPAQELLILVMFPTSSPTQTATFTLTASYTSTSTRTDMPIDRQRAYRQAYEREVRNAGAPGSDLLEQQVTAELLHRYRESALVPVGSRWAKTPLRVQEAAKSADGVTVVEDVRAGDVKKPSPLLILAAVGIILLLAGIFLFTNRAKGDTEIVAEITPEIEATATPLALEAQDNIIREGDDERSVAYPVSLQLALPDGSPPRL